MTLGEGFRPRQETTSRELLGQVEAYYPKVTAKAASKAHLRIVDLHTIHKGTPPKDIITASKESIDAAARDAMSEVLHSIPFRTISVGSEGEKEACYTGVAAPSLKGEFGQIGYPTMWKVSDVVEGTDFAVGNTPGSSSVIALTTPNGIMPTPEKRKYMMKLIAPSQARGIVSLQQDHETNLRDLIKKLRIQPEDLTQVTLNTVDEQGEPKKERSVNQKFIDAARKVGVNLVLIDHGDFVPGVKSALDPRTLVSQKPMIVVGRSGFEEATMDAAAAKALGGFAEAQEYFVLPKDKDGNFQYELGKYLSLDTLVPADPDEILVSISSITGDVEHFDMPRVRNHDSGNGHLIRTLLVTHKGVAHKDLHVAF